MDEQQIKDWLGIGPDVTRPLIAEIVEAMRDVPFPEDDPGHMKAFQAFLAASPERGEGIFATEVQQWLDRDGNVITARAEDPPTAYRWDDQRTHQLLKPRPGTLAQAITLCGKRGLEVPGRGEVNCPRCIATRAE